MPNALCPKSIQEGNVLIARFMGAKFIAARDVWFNLLNLPGYAVATKRLDYNASWDWLMPVVERIETVGNWQVTIHGKGCAIHDHVEHDDFCRCFEATGVHVDCKGYTEKIDFVWHAVVKWITWYNNINNN